jgi:hypothetical protein
VSSPARVLVEDPPQRRRDPETLLGRSAYRLGAGKAGPIRVNAVLRTKACQTKPIRPIDRSGRGPAKSAVAPSLRADVQTKPICRHGQEWSRAGEGAGGAVARARCAKRTQFALPQPGKALPMVGAIAPNEANWQRSLKYEVSSEQSPAASPPNLPTSNFRRAKQSQFRPSEGQVLCGKRVMTSWRHNRPRPNKANSRSNNSGQGPARLPVPPIEPIVRNEANFQSATGAGEYGRGLPAKSWLGPLVQTKPIALPRQE